MVLAIQNPIEQEGTYPLPEAQRDRFLFHIIVDYPSFVPEGDRSFRRRRRVPVQQPTSRTRARLLT